MKSVEKWVELGCLWRAETKDGQKYYRARINLKNAGLEDKDVSAVIYTNKFKTEEHQPDFRIYLSRPKEEAPIIEKVPVITIANENVL